MSETAHTPGPWIASASMASSGIKEAIFAGPTGNHILATARDPFGDSNSVTEANARLIAAAPDFLTACKDCLEGHGDWMALMNAAIAKAEGR